MKENRNTPAPLEGETTPITIRPTVEFLAAVHAVAKREWRTDNQMLLILAVEGAKARGLWNPPEEDSAA